MDKKEAQIKNGKPFAFNQVDATVISVADEYTVITYPGNKMTETRHLVAAEVTPIVSDSKLPRFEFRWDYENEVLDVDCINVTEGDKKLFQKGVATHSGHHTDKIQGSGWTFNSKIIWDNKIIFEGVISINLHREIELRSTLTVSSKLEFKEVH